MCPVECPCRFGFRARLALASGIRLSDRCATAASALAAPWPSIIAGLNQPFGSSVSKARRRVRRQAQELRQGVGKARGFGKAGCFGKAGGFGKVGGKCCGSICDDLHGAVRTGNGGEKKFSKWTSNGTLGTLGLKVKDLPEFAGERGTRGVDFHPAESRSGA